MPRIETAFDAPQVCRSWRRAAEQDFIWSSLGARDFGLSRDYAAVRRYGWRAGYNAWASLRRRWTAGEASLVGWHRCHSSSISSMALANGRAATGSYDRTVVVWDRDAAQWTHVLKGHGGQVTCVDMCGKHAASGARDKTVRVWDAVTEACVDAIETSDAVTAVAMSDTRVYAGLRNGRVEVWDRRGGKGPGGIAGQGYGYGHGVSAACSSGTPLHELGRNEHGNGSHDGAVYSVTLGGGGLPLVATGSVDGCAKVWCGETGKLLTRIVADEEGIMSTALSPPSESQGGGSGRPAVLITGGLDGHVRCFDCHSGRPIVSWKAHDDWIRSLASSGDRVATAGRDGHVRAWLWPLDRATNAASFLRPPGGDREATGTYDEPRVFAEVRVVKDDLELEMLTELEEGWDEVGGDAEDSHSGSEKEKEDDDDWTTWRGRAGAPGARRRRCVVRRTFDVEAEEVKALVMDEKGIVAAGRDGEVREWRFTDDNLNMEFFEPPDRR